MESINSKLRIINHWACSGGTIISKCIASFPNIVFLSEVHPYAYLRLSDTNERDYLPTDIIQQLSFNRNNKDPNLCIAAFVGAIEELNKNICSSNKILILRNHSHIDFFVGPVPRSNSLLTEIFSDRNRLLQILTVRHPLDSWLSLINQKWNNQIQFNNFDEYCSRALIMINSMQNIPIIYYEEFCLKPKKILKKISDLLEIEYSDEFQEKASLINLSGDSGRCGEIIKPRKRRDLPGKYFNDFNNSNSYIELCKKLNYDVSISAEFPYFLN